MPCYAGHDKKRIPAFAGMTNLEAGMINQKVEQALVQKKGRYIK
jgi:hypothetical protein